MKQSIFDGAYDCKENDNCIKVVIEDNELYQIEVGCKYLPEHGMTIIGAKDLINVLSEHGHTIINAELIQKIEERVASYKKKIEQGMLQFTTAGEYKRMIGQLEWVLKELKGEV